MLSTLLITIGISCGITGVLALLMVVADSTIANYGKCNIKINNEKELEVQGGKSLLACLVEEGIFIPSACGGRGSCGFCKVKVNKGVGDFLPTELPWLSEDEKKQNIRLSCQVKVKNDFEIEIPEELFKIKQFETTVSSLKNLTHDIKEIRLQLPENISFKAGQFIQFQVPEYELTDESVYRAYSVSSSPSEKDKLELEIRYVPNGICTTYVHKHLKEGDKVTINGPYGDFYLRDSQREIICIAGGSGMAPIKSILLDMMENGIDRKATYFFGARTEKDLFLVDKMKEIEKKLPNFKFVPVLSQPEEGSNWEGAKGLVTQEVEKYFSKLDNHEAYLCGSPGMIDACVKVLTGLGMPEDLIFYDKFA